MNSCIQKFAVVLLLLLLVQYPATAQSDSPIHVGAGFLYDTELQTAGMSAHATLRLFDPIAIAPEFGYYFGGGSSGTEYLWTANLNGHIILVESNRFISYALGGLNLSQGENENRSDAITDYALNAGAGAAYHLSALSIYAEAKYLIQSSRSVALGVGIRYPLN